MKFVSFPCLQKNYFCQCLAFETGPRRFKKIQESQVNYVTFQKDFMPTVVADRYTVSGFYLEELVNKTFYNQH